MTRPTLGATPDTTLTSCFFAVSAKKGEVSDLGAQKMRLAVTLGCLPCT
jgi:hypothetical protein